MTSSSSPLVGGESETETCLSSTESDEAYGSGHISSVSDVKTVRSATKVSVGLELQFNNYCTISRTKCFKKHRSNKFIKISHSLRVSSSLSWYAEIFQSNRTRHKSSEILRQIRSLTTVQVTSPAAAQSVIREIRYLLRSLQSKATWA